MYKHILVPLDNSDLSTMTVGKAVEFALSIAARVTFLNAQADYGATSDGALERTMAPEEFVLHVAGDARGILAKAEVAARAAGVECSSLVVAHAIPYKAILAAAEHLDCDLIFMSSHGRRGIHEFFGGSQTQKVLSHTCLPVLVAAIESNVSDRARDAAVAVIQNEHRAMAAVVRALEQVVEDERSSPGMADLTLLRKMLSYLRVVPVALHHPKEEFHLFDRLSRKTDKAKDVIEYLTGQHTVEPELIAEMEAGLDRLEREGSAAIDPFASVVRRYADMLRSHIGMEERVVIPMARQYLTERDWREIKEAFAPNGDPSLDAALDAKYRQLFAEILNRVDITH
ncbi:MAG: universal stress protein [Thauera sp.]|jgi:nucleotide-binding universal stress UspA family protein|nr:universal stress protein [Thauera sp.]